MERKQNTWRERDDGVVEIDLTQGKICLIDKIDLERILPWKWCASFSGVHWYAYTHPSKHKTLQMHRLILEPPKGTDVDHINYNGCDNRRCNIRIVTRSQNNANRIKQVTHTTSRFKGVIRSKYIQRPWRAEIKINQKHKHLGYFATEEEAAETYNEAALKYFGEFALLNSV